jgi:threonyl-tRNA synthetase
MRLLQLHSDFIEYEPVQPEIEGAEEATREKRRYENLAVVFFAVERDDTEEIARRAVEEVKASLDRLAVSRLLLYPYSHLSSALAPPHRAIELVRVMAGQAQALGLEVFRAPFGWTKAFSLRVKGHPLAEQSKTVVGAAPQGETGAALKAEQQLVSHWHILDPTGALSPVERFEFHDHPRLHKLAQYEVQKVRAVQQVPPHVTLMRRLSIADYEPGSDPGNLRFYPKGRLMKALLEQYVTQRVVEYGGLEVETPIMYDFHHPALASYLNRFPARQYVVQSEDRELFLRFSACFGQFLIAHDTQLSYRQLPFRIYELTRYSFRREKSGEVTGLRRLRAFTMPDCHCLCADHEQAKREFLVRFRLSLSVLQEIGLSRSDVELAVRVTREFYDQEKDFVHSLVREFGRPALIELWEERFFYFTLKWEFNFIDTLEKASALSTDQIDVENGRRFDITFIDANGSKQHPIILHNSPSGAIERVIYALLEKAHMDQQQGRVAMLPVWLAPTQVRLIPVARDFRETCGALARKLARARIRVDLDDRDESVAKRIREAEREWVPYILVVGEREAHGNQFAVRQRGIAEVRQLTLRELVAELRRLSRGKPWLPLPLPTYLSARPSFPSGS